MDASEHPAVQRHVDAAVADVTERLLREKAQAVHAAETAMVHRLGDELGWEPRKIEALSVYGESFAFEQMLTTVREMRTGIPEERPIMG